MRDSDLPQIRGQFSELHGSCPASLQFVDQIDCEPPDHQVGQPFPNQIGCSLEPSVGKVDKGAMGTWWLTREAWT